MYRLDGQSKEGDKTMPRILIIDDDESILELVQDVLSVDYDVVAASSASEGLDLLKEKRFDLLILDLGIPGLSGADAIRRVREENKNRIPILVVSAYTELRRLVSGLAVDGILAKPFSLSQLEARVAEMTGKTAPSDHPVTGVLSD